MSEMLCPNCEVLQCRVAELEAQVARLTELVAELQRAGKRQAAPFAKRPPKPEPRTPGRKSGEAHSEHGHRTPPTPGSDRPGPRGALARVLSGSRRRRRPDRNC